MNSGKTIFAQLMDFVPAYEFRKCVDRYNGNHKVISFSCWDQYLCMAFAQLTYRESLRDIQVCLRATQSRLYHWASGEGLPQYPCPRQSDQRLADLCRLRSNPHRKSQKTLRRRFLRHRTGSSGLCLGFDHHRPLSGPFPLGRVPETQRGGKTPYPSGSAWEHSFRGHHHHGKSPRCQYPRPIDHRGGGHLYHGSRLSRFCPPLQDPPGVGILCHPDKNKLQPNTPLLPARRQIHRRPMRSDCRPQGITMRKRITRKNSAASATSIQRTTKHLCF